MGFPVLSWSTGTLRSCCQPYQTLCGKAPVLKVISTAHAHGSQCAHSLHHPLQGHHHLPLPSPPSTQPKHPKNTSPQVWTLVGTSCPGGAFAVPVPPAGCGSHVPPAPRGPCAGWDKAACCPLVHYAPAGFPPSPSPSPPSLLPLSPVPAVLQPLSWLPALLLLLLPPMASGRAGISCRFQAGDTQLRLRPICHRQGHLPLASSPSAARHHYENPPTWQ